MATTRRRGPFGQQFQYFINLLYRSVLVPPAIMRYERALLTELWSVNGTVEGNTVWMNALACMFSADIIYLIGFASSWRLRKAKNVVKVYITTYIKC